MSDPRLEAPYEPASVMSTIQGMAKEADAWSAGGTGIPELAVGDVVYVSQPDHVGTIVSVERSGDASVKVTTVDGGSLDGAGRQLIVKWDRAFGYDGSVTAGPMAGQGRAVFRNRQPREARGALRRRRGRRRRRHGRQRARGGRGGARPARLRAFAQTPNPSALDKGALGALADERGANEAGPAGGLLLDRR